MGISTCPSSRSIPLGDATQDLENLKIPRSLKTDSPFLKAEQQSYATQAYPNAWGFGQERGGGIGHVTSLRIIREQAIFQAERFFSHWLHR